ncbi:MAG: Vms1/Ankzf1 family peptidyl-tRNA hydrolase [Halanaeroarchaeum sp.]
MLDRLLGRASLEARIEELEDERDSLAARLKAESERRSEAVSERQAAEERVNRLEDRVAELEDRVERAERDEGEVAVRREETIRGERLSAILDRIASVETGPEGALTAMVDDSVPEPVRDCFGDRTPLVSHAAPAIVYADDAYLLSVALRPPVAPEPFVRWDDAFQVDPAWFEPRGEYALALVRADQFAMGEYRGRERVSLTGFESDVKGAHSKGGFSQSRFERRRDAQIEAHLSAVREALADRDAERLYLVGESTLLSEIDVEATVTRPSDATGAPETAIEAAFDDFWSVPLTVL